MTTNRFDVQTKKPVSRFDTAPRVRFDAPSLTTPVKLQAAQSTPATKVAKPNIISKAAGLASRAFQSLFAGPIERTKAAEASIQQRSLEPLNKSFAKQNDQMMTPEGILSMLPGGGSAGGKLPIRKAADKVTSAARADWDKNFAPKWGRVYDEMKQLSSRLDFTRETGAKYTSASRRYDRLLQQLVDMKGGWAKKHGVDIDSPSVKQESLFPEPLPTPRAPEATAQISASKSAPRPAPQEAPQLPRPKGLRPIGEYLKNPPGAAESTLRATPKPQPSGGGRTTLVPDEAKSAFESSVHQNIPDVRRKVDILDYVKTPEYVLEKIGLAREAKTLRVASEGYTKELPQQIDKISAWHEAVKDIPDASKRIFQYLDGNRVMLSEREEKVAKEIRMSLRIWADRLKIPGRNRIANYITHIFEQDLIQKEFDPDLAKLITDRVPGSVYDPFLEKRLGTMGYKEDVFAALDAYVKRATRKVHMDPALEQLSAAAEKLDLESYNYVQRYASRVNMRPTEIENLLDNLIKKTAGYRFGQRPVANLGRKARQIVYRGTLGLNIGSAVRNLTQGVNTYAKLGEKHTIIGYSKLLSRLATNNLDELYENGVLADNLIQERQIGVYRKALQKMDTVLFSVFDFAEKINRGSAYFGAKAKALEKGMSEQDAIDFAKRLVRETQFSFASIDVPVAMNDDVVKIVTQLQSYNVKQIEFLGRMVKNKEWGGIARYIGGSMAMLYSLGTLLGMKPQDLIPTFRLGGAPIPTMLGAGLDYTLGRTDQKKQDAKGKLARGIFSVIPAGAQLRKTYQGAQVLSEGKSVTPSGKTRYRVRNNASTSLRALLFGPSTLPEAQRYYESLDNKGEKKKANRFD